jgi:hypothetical protein
MIDYLIAKALIAGLGILVIVRRPKTDACIAAQCVFATGRPDVAVSRSVVLVKKPGQVPKLGQLTTQRPAAGRASMPRLCISSNQ